MLRLLLTGAFAAGLVLLAVRAHAMTPEEHASHHPGGAPAGAPVAPAMGQFATQGGAPGMTAGTPMGMPAATPAASGMPGGGMGDGMGEMMRKMMAPASSGAAAQPAMAGPTVAGGMGSTGASGPSRGCAGGDCGSGAAARTPIYPSLMTLPALTPEKRSEIDALANQQISEGMGRLKTGSESLDRATKVSDHAAMQEAVGVMREGLDEVGAGIAARRVLSEGKAPRNLALDWFKREMSLASPIAPRERHLVLGLPPFHVFTMALLIVFAVCMLVMYFFKMRRESALFGRIRSDAGKPPPGSAPPLAGTPASPPPATAPPSSKAS